MKRISFSLFLSCIVSHAQAGDGQAPNSLSAINGNWATSAENCQKWKDDGFETTAEKSGNVMSIIGNEISWTRGSCTLGEVQNSPGKINASANCEYKSNESSGKIAIELISANRIVMKYALSGYFSPSLATPFVRCNCMPASADDTMGCQ